MKATIRITNRTEWRTDQLRAFVVQAREIVFGKERKPLHVTFLRSRSYCHGRATVRGSQSRVWLPSSRPETMTDLRLQLAQILVHELAHNAGARGELWMRRSTQFGWGTGWQERAAWALALPLERRAAPAPIPTADRHAAKLAQLDARAAAWRTKAKRAATALRKIARSRTYHLRKLAAAGGQEVKP